jgi:hypothetical protein
MKTLLTTLALLATLGTANAEPVTANEWIKDCEGKLLVMQVSCFTYARGVADGVSLWNHADQDSAPVCIPNSVTANQLVAVGRKFFKDSPKDRHLAAGVFLGFAFLDAWPCEGMVRKGTANR